MTHSHFAAAARRSAARRYHSRRYAALVRANVELRRHDVTRGNAHHVAICNEMARIVDPRLSAARRLYALV